MTEDGGIFRPRTICVVTGGRADYGLLAALIKRLSAEPSVDLRLVATAGHFLTELGESWREIERDGFRIDAKDDMLLASENEAAIAKSTGLIVTSIADAFERLAPDLIVLLGDRFETLGAAVAASCMRIPIAHLHGGEITAGAIDDAMRHAISKLSHLHFVATDEFAQRLMRMGEERHRIFTAGAIGLDIISDFEPPSRRDWLAAQELDENRKFLVATVHPETLSADSPEFLIDAVLLAFEELYKEDRDIFVLFSGSNADSGGRLLNERIRTWATSRSDYARFTEKFGQKPYLAAITHGAAVVGNSSSGIIEAPYCGVPTVNIGNRQDGRPQAESIVNCPVDASAIKDAMVHAMNIHPKLESIRRTHPYGGPGATKTIADILASVELEELLNKSFADFGLDDDG